MNKSLRPPEKIAFLKHFEGYFGIFGQIAQKSSKIVSFLTISENCVRASKLFSFVVCSVQILLKEVKSYKCRVLVRFLNANCDFW